MLLKSVNKLLIKNKIISDIAIFLKYQQNKSPYMVYIKIAFLTIKIFNFFLLCIEINKFI